VNLTIVDPTSYTLEITQAGGQAGTLDVALGTGHTGPGPVQVTRQSKLDAAVEQRPADHDLIEDLTGIDYDHDYGTNAFTVVADSPAYVNCRTPIEDQAQTPWAAQVPVLPFGQPALRRDYMGRLWLAYCDRGEIKVRVRDSASPRRSWEARASAFEADHEHPDIAPRADGTVLVIATHLEGGRCHIVQTRDDGESWGTVERA